MTIGNVISSVIRPVIDSVVKENTMDTVDVPLSISGLQLWLDASDVDTLTVISNNVTQWNDKSGNDNHATQTNASLQPTLVIDGVGIGLNGVDATPSQIMNVASLTLQNRTLFAVLKNQRTYPDTTTEIDFILHGSDMNFSSFNGFHGSNDFPAIRTENLTNPTYRINGVDTVLNGTYLANTAVILTATGEKASLISTSVSILGQSGRTDRSHNGSVGEILVYDNVLSIENIAIIESYLSAKWGCII